mmetsp:Transcript_8905/g.9878  ORF Transcript_8905/g.9878 Transcript_8905/m.9878 type:complete len:502 (-) Transcript_8905:138-1643(-)
MSSEKEAGDSDRPVIRKLATRRINTTVKLSSSQRVKSTLNVLWNIEYFECDEYHLYVYSSMKDRIQKKPANRFIDLKRITNVSKDEQRLQFTVTLDSSATQTVSCETKEKMTEWLQYISDATSTTKTTKKHKVSVYFADNDKISFRLDKETTTAEDLWWKTCEHLQLPELTRGCFFIWATGGEVEVLCCNDDLIVDLETNWPQMEVMYSQGGKASGSCRFVFKTSATLPLTTERSVKNKKAISLFYEEAWYYLLNNFYVVDRELAIELAGIQLVIDSGPYNQKKHTRGYISAHVDKLVPFDLLQKYKNVTAAQWESKIAKQHKKFSSNSPLVAHLLYLQRLRQLPYYGSTFFRCKSITTDLLQSSFFTKTNDGEVILAINMAGIHFVYPNKSRHTKTFLFTSILRWDISDEEGLFWFETSNEDRPKDPTREYTLRTFQVTLIDDLINDIVYDLKMQKKILRIIKREQGKGHFLSKKQEQPELARERANKASKKKNKGKKSN